MNKHIKEELIFSIGDEYEKYEFNLKFCKINNYNGVEYLSYFYKNNKIKTILGLEYLNIVLYFNTDILSAVFYYFDGFQCNILLEKIDKKAFSKLKNKEEHYAGKKYYNKLVKGVCIDLTAMSDYTILRLKTPAFYDNRLAELTGWK